MTSPTLPSLYNSPIDFEHGAVPDLNEHHTTLTKVIMAFVQYCGISQRHPSLWSRLAGSSDTLLSGNLNRLYVQASENIAAGAMISLHNSAGSLRVRNANATNNTKPADGFCSTVNGIAAGSVGEVVLGKGVVSLAGLTVAQRYYLSVVNGLVTNVAPVAAGNIEQYIGVAIDANHMFVNLHYWIQH